MNKLPKIFGKTWSPEIVFKALSLKQSLNYIYHRSRGQEATCDSNIWVLSSKYTNILEDLHTYSQLCKKCLSTLDEKTHTDIKQYFITKKLKGL